MQRLFVYRSSWFVAAQLHRYALKRLVMVVNERLSIAAKSFV